jgi:hypothetical protein
MRREPLFVSCFVYCWSKWAGRNWKELEKRQLQDPDASFIAGFRTMGQARRVSVCQEFVDGSTSITRARSRAAGEFLRSQANVWLTIDDDCFVSDETIARLVDCVNETRGMVAMPYVLREGDRPSFWANSINGADIEDVAGSKLLPIMANGLGVTAIHRAAVNAIISSGVVPEVTRPEAHYPALFLEHVADGRWIGEDYAFCELLRGAGRLLHLLCDAECVHGNYSSILAARPVQCEFLVAVVRDNDSSPDAQSTPTAPSPAPHV